MGVAYSRFVKVLCGLGWGFAPSEIWAPSEIFNNVGSPSELNFRVVDVLLVGMVFFVGDGMGIIPGVLFRVFRVCTRGVSRRCSVKVALMEVTGAGRASFYCSREF